MKLLLIILMTIPTLALAGRNDAMPYIKSSEGYIKIDDVMCDGGFLFDLHGPQRLDKNGYGITCEESVIYLTKRQARKANK